MKVTSLRIWKMLKVAKKLKHRFRVVRKNPLIQGVQSETIAQEKQKLKSDTKHREDML